VSSRMVNGRARTVAPDAGACFGPAKGAIDGLVDSKWLPGDAHKQMVGLTFLEYRFDDKLRPGLLRLALAACSADHCVSVD
jgi:hypothetical protein